jgi:hypothetical protein
VYRLALIACVVAAGCAKKQEAAHSSRGADGAGSAAPVEQPRSPEPVVGGSQTQPPPPPPDPGTDTASAKDHSRSDAVLGPTNDSHAFDPIEGGSDKGGRDAKKVKTTGGGETANTPKTTPPPKDASKDVRVVSITAADGKPAPAAVDQTLRTHLSEVKACYDKYPTITGTLALTFTVNGAGALTGATVKSSTVKKIELEACVIGVLQTLKLAKPLGAETKAVVTFAR